MNSEDTRVTGLPSSPHEPAGWVRTCLHGFAVCTAVASLVLICSGGLVTSKEAGMTVPDWPTSYGYNMFAFPVSRWVGGILYEHTHRLLASVVGLMTVTLALWLWRGEPRRWVRWLGVAAACSVVLQGALGGLRVVWHDADLGIFHGCLAQAFLALASVIALVTSPAWLRSVAADNDHRACSGDGRGDDGRGYAVWKRFSRMAIAITTLIYIQLTIGATMRHAHAGLSIRDFPSAYGHWWPPTDAASLSRINAERDLLAMPPTTAAQILLQMVHRIGALLIGVGVASCAWLAWRDRAWLTASVVRLAVLWPGLIAVQITLGMYTIWTNKAADAATAHVAFGAISLVWGVMLCVLSLREAGMFQRIDAGANFVNGGRSAMEEAFAQ